MDVLFRVLHLQEQKLCDDSVSHKVIDRCADKDDAVFEQTAVNIPGTFSAPVALVYIWKLEIAHKLKLELILARRKPGTKELRQA